MENEEISFGPFWLDLRRPELRRDGQPVQIHRLPQGCSAPSTCADSRAYRISHLARRSPSALHSDGIIGTHSRPQRTVPLPARCRSSRPAMGGVLAIMDREAQKQRSQQGQPQQSPGSGAQGSQPQSGTSQPSPSQQQDDELVASQIDDAPQGHSRAIVPVQSSTVISMP